VVAVVLIAEIGVDMSVFLSVYHLAAWAAVCPGNHESAGRQKSGRARKGNIHVRTILVGAAISTARTKGSYLKDKFYRPQGPPRRLGRGARHRSQIGQSRTLANLKRRHVFRQPLDGKPVLARFKDLERELADVDRPPPARRA
jgi:transposase